MYILCLTAKQNEGRGTKTDFFLKITTKDIIRILSILLLKLSNGHEFLIVKDLKYTRSNTKRNIT